MSFVRLLSATLNKVEARNENVSKRKKKIGPSGLIFSTKYHATGLCRTDSLLLETIANPSVICRLSPSTNVLIYLLFAGSPRVPMCYSICYLQALPEYQCANPSFICRLSPSTNVLIHLLFACSPRVPMC